MPKIVAQLEKANDIIRDYNQCIIWLVRASKEINELPDQKKN
jgi:hypothetical protein